MALDDLLISTGVDNLIKLVRERGRIDIRDAAAELGMPVQGVEDWAHVLEGEGLIKIQYQLTQVILVWSPLAGGEQEKKQRSVGERKMQVVGKLESLSKNVEEGKVELSALQDQLRSAQAHTQGRLEKLSADLAESEKLNAQLKQMLTERQAALAQSRKDSAELQKEMESFQSNLASLPGKGGKLGAEEQMRKLADAEEKLESKLKSATKVFDSVQGQVEALQKRLASDDTQERMADLKQALEDFKFARAEMEKTANTILGETKAMSGEVDRLTEKLKVVESRRAEKIQPRKMTEQADALAKQVAAERKEVLEDLQQNLAAVRKQVEAYTQAQYQYQTIGARVESLRAALGQSKAEMENMEQTMQHASQSYSSDLQAAKSELESEREEYERLGAKAKDMEQMLSHLGEMQKGADALSIKLQGLIKEAQIYGLTSPAMAAGAAARSAGPSKGRMGAGPAGAGASGGARGAGRQAEGEAGGRAEEAGVAALPPELAQRVAITSAEEEEFEKKRQEMALLVRRMWEEDRKPKNG